MERGEQHPLVGPVGWIIALCTSKQFLNLHVARSAKWFVYLHAQLLWQNGGKLDIYRHILSEPPVPHLKADKYKYKSIWLATQDTKCSFDTWIRSCRGFTQWMSLTKVLRSSRRSWISLLVFFSCLCKCSANMSPWPETPVLLPPILSSSKILLTPVTRWVENNYKE